LIDDRLGGGGIDREVLVSGFNGSVMIPTIWASVVTSGPPELPGLMVAS